MRTIWTFKNNLIHFSTLLNRPGVVYVLPKLITLTVIYDRPLRSAGVGVFMIVPVTLPSHNPADNIC